MGRDASAKLVDKAVKTIAERGLADAETPVVLMVSGGSDSTALAYVASELRDKNVFGALAIVHVNHQLRGADADADEEFVRQLADVLHIDFESARVDVPSIAEAEHGNVEAVARRERYRVAHEALERLCRRVGAPVSEGRLFVAHTADDRIENFYMRSIVGTGPGGFRSMLYLNGQVARPLLDCSRDDLRAYIQSRVEAGLPVARDADGALWREDATNEHTDRFRAFVRHEIVPPARERNPQLVETLTRTMNLIADEDDMLEDMAARLEERCVTWLAGEADAAGDSMLQDAGCILLPALAASPIPLRRRVCLRVLGRLLGPDARVETASVDAVLAGYGEDGMNSGYATNIQGNLAVSANKHGVRVEPMAAYRLRRKRS